MGHTTAQLTIKSLSLEIEGTVATDAERAEATARAADTISAEPRNRAKREARDQVRTALLAYIEKLDVGADFQAPDFNNALHESGLAPDPDVYDARATGGMFRRLVGAGVLTITGQRMCAGGKFTNFNSTMRPVYRVVRLPNPKDF